MKNNDLKGLHYVIMGATSGIALEVARRLEDRGASLLLIGRNKAKLKNLELSLDHDHVFLRVDLLNSDFENELRTSLKTYVSKMKINGFAGGVYCAGIAPIMPLKALSEQPIEEQFRINYTGAILFSKVLVEKGVRNKITGTSLVHIASVSAIKGEKGLSIYGGTKAALISSVKSIAREIAPLDCRINCISPGWLNTQMNIENERIIPQITDSMNRQHPLGLGSVRDVASVVLFLLTTDSKWITGSNMIVDGGFLA